MSAERNLFDMPKIKSTRFVLLTLGAALLIGAVAWRSGFLVTKAADPAKAGPAPVPVTTTTVKEQDIPTYLSGIGSVTPLYAVVVKARVDGQLEKVMFSEGEHVAAGTVLAQIDSRPFKAQLDLAQAQKARDAAQLANSMVDLERYSTLLKQDSIAQQQVSTQQATVDQLKATVQADQATIDNAQVQLDYTTIRAPISGRTGVRLVDPGNIVRASDNSGIVSINQIDPIAVLFTLPEDRFQDINRAIQAHGRTPLEVQAFGREDNTLLGSGKLMLINNQIDTATGTVQLKAQFANAAHKLWPGQYINVHLVMGTRQRATTVPASAVQRGPNGLYAYVANADDTVAMQSIRVGLIQDGVAIVEEGLQAGTRVVTDGQYKLKPGAKIVEASKPAAPGKGGAKKGTKGDTDKQPAKSDGDKPSEPAKADPDKQAAKKAAP
jgi:multidrug efflux system membrane fusion protein